MSNPNFLDLDAIAPEERTIKIFGESHAVVPVSVDTFIINARAAQAQDAKVDQSLPDQIEFMIKLIASSVPSLPVEKLRTMRLDQLNAILAFAQRQDGTAVGNAEAKAAAAKSPQ
jgi:hypothetical protein